jgi:UDP-GlcNAc3NAcA epimerase
MYDVTLFYQQRAKETISLAKWGLLEGKYVLCTLHRAENTDDPQRLESILSALRVISHSCTVVLPLHPRTRNLLFSTGRQHLLDKLVMLEPIPYLEIQRLEMGARAILTDSGGIQKEAYFHKVPCITLRDETEWVETVNSGWNVLAGAVESSIISAFNCAPIPASAPPFYGDGASAARIVAHLATI